MVPLLQAEFHARFQLKFTDIPDYSSVSVFITFTRGTGHFAIEVGC